MKTAPSTTRDNRRYSPWRTSVVSNDLADLLVPTDEGKGFETLGQVDAWRTTWVTQLRKAGTPASRRLADRLEACRRDAPCNSPACPICKRRLRQVVFAWKTSIFFPGIDLEWIQRNSLTTLPAFAKLPYLNKLAQVETALKGLRSVTLLHRSWSVPEGHLDTVIPSTIKKRVRQQIDRTALKHAKIIGGPHGQYVAARKEWDIHFHLTVWNALDKDIANFESRFYRKKPEDVGGRKLTPLVSNGFTTIRDYVESASYAHQSLWPLRPNKKDPDSKREPMKVYVLPEPQNVEWLLWLDTLTFNDIIFTKNVGDLKSWNRNML